MSLPYNHEYSLRLSIGFVNAERIAEINPATDSSYSEDEWNALSADEQRQWLNDAVADWADEYIETSWSI